MHRNESAVKREFTNKSRLLKIPGVPNFRDMGGYKTQDGLTVKWGQLYRSGHLADLTPRGLDILTDLNLSAIIDFRSNDEAQRHPDKVPAKTRAIHLSVMDQNNREISKEIRERIKDNHYDGYTPDRLILKAYQQFPTEFNLEFKTFLHAIRDAKGNPVLWHCKSGKDRTGYAAAILLRLLDVDLDTIYQDYLLSNQYVKRMDKRVLTVLLVGGLKAYRMVKPLMGVQLEWLKAAFEMIDKEWGSFDSYVSDGLALSPSDVQQMRDVLLE